MRIIDINDLCGKYPGEMSSEQRKQVSKITEITQGYNVQLTVDLSTWETLECKLGLTFYPEGK